MYIFVGGRQVHLQIIVICVTLFTLHRSMKFHVSQCSKVVETQNLIIILALHVEFCSHSWSHMCYFIHVCSLMSHIVHSIRKRFMGLHVQYTPLSFHLLGSLCGQ